jgi:hypothetical protein
MMTIARIQERMAVLEELLVELRAMMNSEDFPSFPGPAREFMGYEHHWLASAQSAMQDQINARGGV